MRVLAINLYGDFGHFRKFFSTSSPLTFSFPPPPTIAGILGAIYGASKDEYLNIFDYKHCRTALKIVNNIKKVRIGINLINTKDNNWQLVRKKFHEPRTQIRTEFLFQPSFTIFVNHDDVSVFEKLIISTKEHRCIYSVSLGLSELLANFEFAGLFEFEEYENDIVEISTPLLMSNILDNFIEFETGKKYLKEKIPVKMNSNRKVEEYEEVIYEPQGGTIKAKVKKYQKLEDGTIITFF